MGWGNPAVSWSEMERILAGRPRSGPTPSREGAPEVDGPGTLHPADVGTVPVREERPSGPSVARRDASRRRGRLAGLEPHARSLPAAVRHGRGPHAGARPVRRTAHALHLQLPRRREPARGARRGGPPARPGVDRAHRSRRHVRGGPVRGGRAGARRAHGLRRRALAGPVRPAERGGRSRGGAPAGAGARPGGVPGDLAGDHRGRDGPGGGEGSPGPRSRACRGDAARPGRRAHRLPQGPRAPGPGRGRAGGGGPGAGPPDGDCSGRSRWPSSSPTTGCPSTPSATTCWPSSPPAPAWPRSRAPPRTTPRPTGPGSPPRSRRSGRGAASTRPRAGCRRAPRTCAPGRRWPPGSRATPRRSRTRRCWGGSAPSSCRCSPPSCRRSTSRRGRPRRAGCGTSPTTGPASATAAGRTTRGPGR